MTFDNTLPHALPWNYPWIKDEIERRDEYIAQLEAELAHQRPQNHDSGAIEGESVKVPAEDESGAHSEPDSREKLEADVRQYANPEGNTGTLGACWERKMFEFLDRQAAITERECLASRLDSYELATMIETTVKERNELEAKIAETRGLLSQAHLDWLDDVGKWQEEREKLTAERDELQRHCKNQRRELAELNNVVNVHRIVHKDGQVDVHSVRELCRRNDELTAEREQYRKLFGMALDWAHEITMLESSVDEGMS